MYKHIYYFVTCEISDETMSTACMNVICTNEIMRMLSLGLTPAYDRNNDSGTHEINLPYYG